MGHGTCAFQYDPQNPTAFSPEGTLAEERSAGSEFIRIFTAPFDRDVFVKGKIQARLTVSSSCEDTSFYIRISIKNGPQAYVLRHDITSLCFQLGSYTPNDVVTLDFCFDEYAFLLKQGEQLQIDIATNRVYLDRSTLYLPVE